MGCAMHEPRDRRELERELEREHQPRTLRLSGQPEPQRISQADEQPFADAANAARAAERQRKKAEHDAEVLGATRDVLRSIEQLRELAHDEDGEDVRAIVHHARRMGPALERLLRRHQR